MIFGWVAAVLCPPGVWGSGGDGGHADVDRDGWVGTPVDLGEFVAGAGQADLESFGFAVPAFAFGFGDAGDQVVVDLCDAGPLGGRGPVHAAAQAAVLVNARGPERAAAGAGGDLAELIGRPRNSAHSSSVGVRYSSLGRRARRRVRNARWAWIASSGVGGRSAAGEAVGQVLGHWEPRWEPPGRTTFRDSERA